VERDLLHGLDDEYEALRLRPSKTSVTIAVDLAERIMAADLPVGATLPNERTMIETFGVGRASVREALRLLETRGLIRMRPGPGGGPVVCRPAARDFSAAVSFAMQAERATAEEVLRAREDLSPFMARLAAQRATTVQISELESTIATLRDGLADDRTLMIQGRRFEALVAEAGGNVVVRLLADALVAIIWDTVTDAKYSMQRRRWVLNTMTSVVEAIAQQDPDKAEANMARYVKLGSRYWRKSHPDLGERVVRWKG
jgi:DNA-binding FadR family transcriptional regulator